MEKPVFEALVLKDESCDKRSMLSLKDAAQLTNGRHDNVGKLESVIVKRTGSSTRCDVRTYYITDGCSIMPFSLWRENAKDSHNVGSYLELRYAYGTTGKNGINYITIGKEDGYTVFAENEYPGESIALPNSQQISKVVKPKNAFRLTGLNPKNAAFYPACKSENCKMKKVENAKCNNFPTCQIDYKDTREALQGIRVAVSGEDLRKTEKVEGVLFSQSLAKLGFMLPERFDPSFDFESLLTQFEDMEDSEMNYSISGKPGTTQIINIY